ncbi:MAG: hypothetical protein JSS27_21135 [Planctomycetes bacterium]|nr:hypothetical protein [Planctomycetota bacterium]
MDIPSLGPDAARLVDDVLGYLNLSSGKPDARFRKNWNELCRRVLAAGPPQPLWDILRGLLAGRLSELTSSSAEGGPFADASQAQAIVQLALGPVLDNYRTFHDDLLRHQSAESLFQTGLLARTCEAVLQVGGPWDEHERIADEARDRLNDFLGYRPVAVLRSPQRVEPYRHEWFAPLPVYWRDVGPLAGPYHDLITQALEIVRGLDRELLERAWFDFDLLDELAVDPRAYDFDHPVNKRPNHQFGQWDPHRLDQQARYRRFVLQSVTIDALLSRVTQPGEAPEGERLFEAATVLVGTMLMSSAIGGRGPETHDSSVTLAKLYPHIAKLRDDYYERLLAQVPGEHGERLRAESARLHQPFGGARQHLNQRLAAQRGTQLEHVHLSLLFARMGQPEASRRRSQDIPVTSARILCEISDRLCIGNQDIDHGQPHSVYALLGECDALLHRGIECGALVDPWNILGFQGQFSLFPALENSVRDHRVDVLVHVLRQVFDLHVRLCGEAAAQGNQELLQQATRQLGRLARWWDRFASVEVSGVERLVGQEVVESAAQVASALGAWHAAGAAAADIAFWRDHVADFNSIKSYALVATALLDKEDYIASRALLMQWLGQADHLPLAEGDYSFHELALRWLSDVCRKLKNARGIAPDAAKIWPMVQKFFDYFEANADTWWSVPSMAGTRRQKSAAEGDDDEGESDTFDAAYETMVYRDSAGDGREGNTLEGDGPDESFDLDAESEDLGHRLALLVTVARLWNIAALAAGHVPAEQCQEMLAESARQARGRLDKLLELLDEVASYQIADPLGTHAALIEYERQRSVKESLLARTIITATEMATAARALAAALDEPAFNALGVEMPRWVQLAVRAMRQLRLGDTAAVRAGFGEFLQVLGEQPVLYIPLARNGKPRSIVAAQGVQQVLNLLARELPRQGLMAEAVHLLDTAQAMEKHRPQGEGAVTEFDRLFEAAYAAMVDSLCAAADESRATDQELVDVVQYLTEALLHRWLTHSQSLRLSILEKVADKTRWQALIAFIENYGHDIFTPRFLNLSNLRAILHQSVDKYLQQLIDEDETDWRLLRELGDKIPRAVAVEQLSMAIEAIVENYAEFKDYHSTTTQSDRGELLYVLLDFLRLKASYERYAWNIHPVLLAHETFVRRGKMSAAEIWRRWVVSRTADAADWHRRRHEDLHKQYGVRLPTVADRINERFIRGLEIDRVRALIKPAIEEPRVGLPPTAFELFEQELIEWAEHPTGAGIDVPAWLALLEQEAEQVVTRLRRHGDSAVDYLGAPTPTDWNDLVAQVRAIEIKDA